MNNFSVVPVILSGGRGTRLWPLSTPDMPKQYLRLLSDRSLLQESIDRSWDLDRFSRIDLRTPIIVSNSQHVDLTNHQLRELGRPYKLILEPRAKNTAPSLTLAALLEAEECEDSVMVVLPADHLVKVREEFVRTLARAIYALDSVDVAVLGIKPSDPNVSYGYIHTSKSDKTKPNRVLGFKEKPDLETAGKFFEAGGYYWNSGVFVLRVRTWLDLLKTFREDISLKTHSAWLSRQRRLNNFFLDERVFEEIPAESIDYAVIEKCSSSDKQIAMLQLDAGWSDLGTWGSLERAYRTDSDGNVTRGPRGAINSSQMNSCFIQTSGRSVTTVGISDLIIIDDERGVTVANKNFVSSADHLSERRDTLFPREDLTGAKVYRGWGWYKNIEVRKGFKVKHIHVDPGGKLSLQRHKSRSEHWTIVNGVADVIVGEYSKKYRVDQSVYIPMGETHRLFNDSKEPLDIIEIQIGSYLGEDDIERLDDVYGRVLSVGEDSALEKND